MKHTSVIRTGVTAVALALLLPMQVAQAGDGHDHGETKAAATLPALPRFAAHSALFDVVGILANGELVVYLDRNASNEPIAAASIELESGNFRQTGKFEAALGEYHFDGKAFATAGDHAITITVKAGADSDLLTADLHVEDATSTAAPVHHWTEWLPWSVAALAAALGMFAGWRVLRRRGRATVQLTGGAL